MPLLSVQGVWPMVFIVNTLNYVTEALFLYAIIIAIIINEHEIRKPEIKIILFQKSTQFAEYILKKID
jgi:hypothetical protein